jgi:hypothetical protein
MPGDRAKRLDLPLGPTDAVAVVFGIVVVGAALARSRR